MIFSTIITMYIFLSEPGIQTLLARLASDYLSKELKTEIRVKGLNLSITRGLVLEGFSLKDRQHQEIVSAAKLSVIPGNFSYRKRILDIRKIYLEKGVIQLLTHKGDSSISFQFLIDYFTTSDTIVTPSDTTAKKWDIFLFAIQLSDTRFHFQNENKQPADTGMDYSNIDVSHINMMMTNVKPVGDTINARLNYLSAIERSGLILKSMSAQLSVSSKSLKAKGLKIKTGYSDLDLDLEFKYDSWIAFTDFINKVTIKAEINPSVLELSEIGNFAPVMYSMKDQLRLAGNVKGTVSNFRAREFRFAFGKGTRFEGNINATGLPNVEETFVDLNIKTFITNQEDIESLNLPTGAGHILLPSFLRNAGTFTLRGMFTGFYNDFVANARLSTGIGSISTDLTLRTKKGTGEVSYIGQANAQHLNLGDLFKSKEIGFITFRADLNGKGLNINDVDVKATLIIDSLYLNNYIYRNLDVKGALREKQFTGALTVNDPNLKLDFNGLVDLSDSLPVFDFTSKIHHAQLFALKLLDRDSIITLSSSLKVNIKGNSLDNMEGIIRVDSTWYIEGENVIPLNRLSLLTSRNENQEKSYHLVSDFANADITGNFSFSKLIPSLSEFIKNYLASFSMKNIVKSDFLVTNQRMDYTVRFRNTDALTAVFAPFLRVAPNTVFKGEYDEQGQIIAMKGNSDYVSIYGMELKNWYISATSRPDNLKILTGCEQFELKKNDDTDTLTILLDSLQLTSFVKEDSIHYDISWKDIDSLSQVGGFLSFRNSPSIELKLEDFKVWIDHRYWNVSPGNYIVFDSAATTINDLAFLSANQFLKINGNISGNPKDTLYADFNKVDISNADYFIGDPNINLDGILSGRLKLMDIYKNLTVLADLHIDTFSFNKEVLGDATFYIHYDTYGKKFKVKSEIIYQGNAGVAIPFTLEGNYFMGEKEPRMDFDLKLKNLNLKMVSPFVSSFMTGIKGYASGAVKITGNLERPILDGKINLLRTEFKISYLNVPYSVADEITVNENYFGFDNIKFYDSLGNKATLNGRINHDHFKNVELDLNVDFADFSAFKNSYAQNNRFYGTASGTGNVKITGPINDINISVKAKNSGGTHVIIPISTTAEVGENEYIKFEKHTTDSVHLETLYEPVQSSALSLDLALQVNPIAVLEVYFPDQLGSINAKGTGNFTMSMTPYSDFSMGGTYTIQKGTFNFRLRNLMNYNLVIREGSHIFWTGDPLDANISMSAVYKSRIPLENLTTDPDMKSVRVPVECIVHLTGKLMNPDISVSIELPNVDEYIKQQVYSSIDTTNATEMNQQMINILVFGQFKSGQGINSGNIDVGTTSLSLLTNMANSFTSRFSKSVNIGINYSRSTTNAGQEIDVAISTQVFNERLHLDGLFGMNSMNPNSTAQRASTIVGDINIAYDLNRNRRWQLRGFNRTNTYDNLNLNYSPYTQGFGLAYKRDFNSWGDLFKKSEK